MRKSSRHRVPLTHLPPGTQQRGQSNQQPDEVVLRRSEHVRPRSAARTLRRAIAPAIGRSPNKAACQIETKHEQEEPDDGSFLRNSNLGSVERVGRDAVRISGGDPGRIAEALALWQARNENAEIRVSDGD
jgi:hypothetical protein